MRMNKKFGALVLVGALTLSFAVLPAKAPGIMILYGDVYDHLGNPGDSATENSYAFANIYLANKYPGEPMIQILDIDDAGSVACGGSGPACFGDDFGSQWPSWDALDHALVILETVEGFNGWAGINYTTSTAKELTPAMNQDLPDSTIEEYPTLSISSGADWINVTWSPMTSPNITGHYIYRSPDDGSYTILSAASFFGMNWYYNNTGLAVGTYYYRIGVTYNVDNVWYNTTGRSEFAVGTIGVDPPPTIQVLEPGGSAGQSYTVGDLIDITWLASDNNPWPNGGNVVNLSYDPTPTPGTPIANNEFEDGLYTWDTSGVTAGTYYVCASVYDSAGQEVYDCSSFSFDIIGLDPPPTIQVLEPGGSAGQSYTVGDLIDITWLASDNNPWPNGGNVVNLSYDPTPTPGTPIANNEFEDGLYTWDTSGVTAGTYYVCASVYDSAGQEVYDCSSFSFDIIGLDPLPTIETWEPGGTPGQTYTQGDLITVTWTASDNNPLPANPINITYGTGAPPWTVISTDEANDQTYTWDTSAVPCPGTYWMRLSVYDSIGQTTFDVGNFSFDLFCVDLPPTIEAWEPGGTVGQTYTQGDLITVAWTASDDNPLPANPINITYGTGAPPWTTIATNEANDQTYTWDTSAVPCPGTYWMRLSVYDSIGQTTFDQGNNSFVLNCPDNPPTIVAWEPGGTPGQTYVQGDIVTVTWTASDDNPLPANPINITYGTGAPPWTVISTDEANDQTYTWDTSAVPCPGTYWMRLSVYDSAGQTTFDVANNSFDLFCPGDSFPTIAAYEPGGTPGQAYTQGDLITVTWIANDDNPLPANPINITYGTGAPPWTIIATDEANDQTYTWDTSAVPCPGTYWMRLSVYDSIGQTTFDVGNYSFDLFCVDLPPTIAAWEPGGTTGQTYTQGDLITVTWTASDDNPLPATPINITYGTGAPPWTTIATDEANDQTYTWDTSAVPCPGTYWMNLSVRDSAGQTVFDEGNFSFTLNCPADLPPTIEAWEPGGATGQTYTQGDLITVTWIANDDNPLPANPINITYGTGAPPWTTIATDEVNDQTYTWDTSAVPCPGTYWMRLSVYDSIGQTTFDVSNFSFTITCPVDPFPTIEAWEPGGSAGQTYTVGDTITVTWTAGDNNPLPATPINITFGTGAPPWTTIAIGEANDGMYSWDTTGIPCPGTYWMNLSVYDSAGQTTFDVGNNSFVINCPPDTTAPTISNVDADPSFQFGSGNVNITADVTDDQDGYNVTVNVSITDPNDVTTNISMTYNPATGEFYYEALFSTVGIYDFTVWANDSSGNFNSDTGLFYIYATQQYIAGNVTSGGERLDGVTINLYDDSGALYNTTVTVAVAGIGGVYIFFVDPGTYTVEATKSGYKTESVTVTVDEGEWEWVDFDLKSEDMLWLWLLIILLIIIIVIIVVFLLMRKKKKPEEAAPAEGVEMMPEEGVPEEAPAEEVIEEELPAEGEAEAAAPVAATAAAAAPGEEKTTCIKCGKEIKASFKLCPYCGAKQESESESGNEESEETAAGIPCPNCAKEIPPGFASCPYCGTTP